MKYIWRQVQTNQTDLIKLLRTTCEQTRLYQAQYSKLFGLKDYYHDNDRIISSIIRTAEKQNIIVCKKEGKYKCIYPGSNIDYKPVEYQLEYITNKKMSRGESRIAAYLQEKNFDFIAQKRFKDCVGTKRSLPFDFYLPSQQATNWYEILIEVQGRQHYEPIEFFGGEKAFETQCIHDNIKRQYAKDNEYTFFEIKYDEDEIKSLEYNLKQLTVNQ